jgi:hypothetical protein
MEMKKRSANTTVVSLSDVAAGWAVSVAAAPGKVINANKIVQPIMISPKVLQFQRQLKRQDQELFVFSQLREQHARSARNSVTKGRRNLQTSARTVGGHKAPPRPISTRGAPICRGRPRLFAQCGRPMTPRTTPKRRRNKSWRFPRQQLQLRQTRERLRQEQSTGKLWPSSTCQSPFKRPAIQSFGCRSYISYRSRLLAIHDHATPCTGANLQAKDGELSRIAVLQHFG